MHVDLGLTFPDMSRLGNLGEMPWRAVRTIIEAGLYNIVFEGPDEAAMPFDETVGGRAAWDRAWQAAEFCMRVNA